MTVFIRIKNTVKLTVINVFQKLIVHEYITFNATTDTQFPSTESHDSLSAHEQVFLQSCPKVPDGHT